MTHDTTTTTTQWWHNILNYKEFMAVAMVFSITRLAILSFFHHYHQPQQQQHQQHHLKSIIRNYHSPPSSSIPPLLEGPVRFNRRFSWFASSSSSTSTSTTSSTISSSTAVFLLSSAATSLTFLSSTSAAAALDSAASSTDKSNISRHQHQQFSSFPSQAMSSNHNHNSDDNNNKKKKNETDNDNDDNDKNNRDISSSESHHTTIETGYLNAKDAYDLDQELFSTGYTLEQLMELAGLAVAEAIYDISPPLSLVLSADPLKQKTVLVVCGPGNNGGDGLVAARHLIMFGYNVVVVYPKRSSREEHYEKLVKQCNDVGVQIYDSIPSEQHEDDENIIINNMKKFDVIVDSIFGFSFKGEAREPFGSIIQKMIELQQTQKIPIVAVDVPSGWNVDEGDVANTGMVPDVLVSLTAPKLCSKEFKGRHFVGGKFFFFLVIT